jgi:hypothetical protein
MAVVWRKSGGSRTTGMQCAHADIFTVWAARITKSKCFSITTLRRSFLAIEVIFLISSGGMGRNNNLVSSQWLPLPFAVQPVLQCVHTCVTRRDTAVSLDIFIYCTTYSSMLCAFRLVYPVHSIHMFEWYTGTLHVVCLYTQYIEYTHVRMYSCSMYSTDDQLYAH